jgi:hypothetical protein
LNVNLALGCQRVLNAKTDHNSQKRERIQYQDSLIANLYYIFALLAWDCNNFVIFGGYFQILPLQNGKTNSTFFPADPSFALGKSREIFAQPFHQKPL